MMPATIAARRTGALDSWALGCRVRLVVTDPRDLPAAQRLLDEDLAAIDLACSRFRPDSELLRLDLAEGRPVRLSPLLARALAAALDAARETDGHVDPTVGSAMTELGYDCDYSLLTPDGAPVRVVERPVPGWRRVDLDAATGIVRVPPGVSLDLGATAKALAADLVATRIHEAVGGGVLVGIGGDIAVAGDAPAAGWTVRVQDVTGPADEAADGPTETISLHAGGLATSSVAARRWIRGGRLMHHLLDPRTGLPVVSTWRTVSVAAPTCLAANVASTDSIVRGPGAQAWLTGRGLAARLVDTSGLVARTPGWPDPPVWEPS
jgi:thiamine biosynthesis lipoprotein ApbE